MDKICCNILRRSLRCTERGRATAMRSPCAARLFSGIPSITASRDRMTHNLPRADSARRAKHVHIQPTPPRTSCYRAVSKVSLRAARHQRICAYIRGRYVHGSDMRSHAYSASLRQPDASAQQENDLTPKSSRMQVHQCICATICSISFRTS